MEAHGQEHDHRKADGGRLHIAKDLRELSTAPVLIITARATASDELHGMAAGASAYLTKPCHAGDLREAINELCPANS